MTGIPRELDLGQLLAEQAFVRRLAHSLLYDHADAEDAAQQSWLAALRQPPREAAHARPFLARIVRRVASNLRRSQRRRTAHESAMPPAEPEASVADALARESLRQTVVQELTALPEPYRSTLVLRFFDDLSPLEIARRLQVPDGTVRARSARGLTLLRERLDQRHGGDRAAWGAALAATIRGEPAGVLTATLWVLGATAMHKILFTAAALAALAGALWWFSGSEPAVADLGSAVGGEAAQLAVERTQPPPEREPASPPGATTATPAGADDDRRATGVRGRLVLPSGGPAAGREIQLLALDPTRALDPGREATAPLATLTVHSGTDGRFELLGVVPRSLLLLHAARGEAQSACQAIAATPAPREVVDLGDIALEERGSLTGCVTDAAGAPLAGAEVFAAEVPAFVTLAFNLERFAPEHGLLLALPAVQPQEELKSFAERTTRHLQDLLRKPIALDDRVDLHVIAPPSWLADLWRALPAARTTSGADGCFALRDLGPGANLVVVRSADHAPLLRPGITVAAGATRDLGTLALPAGETLRGRVLGADGRPVPNAAVRVASLPLAFLGVAPCAAEVRTDPAGQFEVRGLGKGRALVAVRPDAASPFAVRGPFATDDDVELRLDAGADLQLRVATPQGAGPVRLRAWSGPIAGELARLDQAHELTAVANLSPQDGVFHATGLPRTTLLLEVSAARCAPRRLRVHPPATAEVALELAAPPLTIVASSAGQPIAGARIRVRHLSADAEPPTLPWRYGLRGLQDMLVDVGSTDAAGRLVLEGLPNAPLTVWAEHPRFGPARALVAMPQTSVLLHLPAAATLDLQLTDAGQPAGPRWRARLTALSRADGGGRQQQLGLPDPRGQIHLPGLDPGAYRLFLEEVATTRFDLGRLVDLLHPFGGLGRSGRTHARTVVLEEGERRQLAIDLAAPAATPAPAAPLHGQVAIDGAPAPDCDVLLGPDGTYDTAKQLRARTGSDGSFTFAQLPEGTHALRVQRAGMTLEARQVQAGPRGGAPVFFAIRTATLHGTVAAASGRDFTGAKVHGDGPAGATASAPIGPDGAFALAGLAQGEWRIHVAGEQLHSAAAAVVTAPSATPLTLPTEPRFRIDLEVGADLLLDAGTTVELRNGNMTWTTSVPKSRKLQFPALAAGTVKLTLSGHPAASGTCELNGPYLHRIELTARGLVRR